MTSEKRRIQLQCVENVTIKYFPLAFIRNFWHGNIHHFVPCGCISNIIWKKYDFRFKDKILCIFRYIIIHVIPVVKGKYHNSKSTRFTLVLRVNNWAIWWKKMRIFSYTQNPFICWSGWSHCSWRKKRWYLWNLCENNWSTFGMHPKGTHFTEIKENPKFAFPN